MSLYPSSTLFPSPTLWPGVFRIPVIPPTPGVPLGEWSAFARGAGYALDMALPIISAQVVLPHMGLSKATLSTPYSSDAWGALQPSRGISLYRSGVQKFAGPIVSRQLTLAQDDGTAVIKVQAVGDEVVLADRLTFPDPSRAATDQTINDYWTYTGAASGAMCRLITDQAGAACIVDRRVPGLTVGVDPNVGSSRTWQGLFDPVLDLLEQIAAASGANLGLRMTSSTGSLTATVVAPRDLSDSVVFSADLANVGGAEFTENAPTATNALVAGQGDLHARTRRLTTTTDIGSTRWGRQVWQYVDRRDTNDPVTLDNAGADTLAKGPATVALSLVLLDSQAATYGADWDLGDKVTVYVGLRDQPKVAVISDVVREIQFSIDENGVEVIQPAVGTVDAKTYLPTPSQRAIQTASTQVSALIRHK